MGDEPAFTIAKEQITAMGLSWLHLPLSGKKANTEPQQQPPARKGNKTDHDAESLSRIAEVADLLKKGESVVVHCAAGMHRTGVVCYLAMRHLNNSPTKCLLAIMQTRQITHEEITKRTSKHAPLCELAEAMMPPQMKLIEDVRRLTAPISPKATKKAVQASEKAVKAGAKNLVKVCEGQVEAEKRLTKRQQRIQAEFGSIA